MGELSDDQMLEQMEGPHADSHRSRLGNVQKRRNRVFGKSFGQHRTDAREHRLIDSLHIFNDFEHADGHGRRQSDLRLQKSAQPGPNRSRS